MTYRWWGRKVSLRHILAVCEVGVLVDPWDVRRMLTQSMLRLISYVPMFTMTCHLQNAVEKNVPLTKRPIQICPFSACIHP